MFRSIGGFWGVVFVILIIEHIVWNLFLGSRVMSFAITSRSDRLEPFGFGRGVVVDVERCTIAFHLIRVSILPPRFPHTAQSTLHALSVQRRKVTFLRRPFPPSDSCPAIDDLEDTIPNPRTARDIVLL
jgi:hypothetical protein